MESDSKRDTQVSPQASELKRVATAGTWELLTD